MPHGIPDWGLVGPKHVTYGLDDLGEHAVRLRSPHLWDRRGDALYLTDFRDGLGMFHTGMSGDGAAVDLMTGHSRQGAYSVRLRAGDDDEQYANMQLALPFQDPSPVGLEFSFSVHEETSEVRAEIIWYDGVNEQNASVTYSHQWNQLWYWHWTGAWAFLDPAFTLNECTRPEHTMKLVVDMTRNHYARFLLDERAYDMRAYAVAPTLDNRPLYWYFAIWHLGMVDYTPDCYIDNVIVTQNEPV